MAINASSFACQICGSILPLNLTLPFARPIQIQNPKSVLPFTWPFRIKIQNPNYLLPLAQLSETENRNSMATIKHFYRDELLTRIEPMRNEQFLAAFPGIKGFRCDSFSRYVGFTEDKRGPFPVQRMIEYKSFPSRHECNARCLNGKCNGACECRCGGVNHGLGALLEAEGVAV